MERVWGGDGRVWCRGCGVVIGGCGVGRVGW